MKRRQIADGELSKELAALPTLDRDSLLERWDKLYKRAPPPKISHQLLVASIAYRMQEQVYGGLNPATRRYLLDVAASLKEGRSILPPKPVFKPGTKLLREWHGKTYEVTILEQGYLFKGISYRSLSEIACIITGVKWSGPAFFGLKSRKHVA